jgi:thimet oligopeptidase
VYDAVTKEQIGYFYLDMYPRDDKYSHFAEFDIIPARKGAGEKQLPVASLVCNFPKPTPDKPSLLLHKDFYTLLHEFGHLIHALLSEAELASYAGTAVPRDFVEAPSQIMENWAFDKTMLISFSKHYKTGESLSAEMAEKLIASQNVKAGLDALQQIFYGITDYTLYDGFDAGGTKSTSDVVREVQNSVTLFPFLEGTLMEASFWHFTGYGAKYYGYMWSLVYAQDMFSVFAEKGLTNPEAGARYRKEVLSKGGSADPLILVKNFLGREPNNKAFLKKLGLE